MSGKATQQISKVNNCPYSQQWSDSGENIMNYVSCCQVFFIILYNTKAVVHFLLPDCFSCVWVCNIVQLLLNQEYISSLRIQMYLLRLSWVFLFGCGAGGALALGIRISWIEMVSKKFIKARWWKHLKVPRKIR